MSGDRWFDRFHAWAGDPKPCAGEWEESKRLGYCDGRPIDRFPAQPINAWTNVMYPVMGLWTALFVRTPEAWVYASTMVFLGVGSFAYHAYPTTKTAALDHAGMYAVFFALVIAAAAQPFPHTWVFMLAMAAFGGWAFAYEFRINLNVMMGVMLAVILTLLSVVAGGLVLMGVISLFSFLVAMGAWLLDRNESLGGIGHGAWHVFTAFAIDFMYIAIHYTEMPYG